MKTLRLLGIVFVLTFAVGASMVKVQAGPCRYKCICGTPYKCCTTNGVESCKPAPDSPLACPQIAC